MTSEEKKVYMKEYNKKRRLDPILKAKDYAQIAACIKKRYQEDPEFRKEVAVRNKAHRLTPEGKESMKKTHHRRKRELGWEPLNSYFSGAVGHHIDKERVIYIPEELHLKHYGHTLKKPETMIEINLLAWDFLESRAY